MKVLLIWEHTEDGIRMFEVTGDAVSDALAAHGSYINGDDGEPAEKIGAWFWDEEGNDPGLPRGVTEIKPSAKKGGPFAFDRIVLCGFIA